MNKFIVFYDNWCPNCNRFKNFIKKVDSLNLIFFKELRNNIENETYKDIDKTLAFQEMASYHKGKWNYGFSSIFLILLRIPLFWVTIPIFYILKLTGFGQYIYKQLAINRKIIPLHCDKNNCEI
ncbi:Protein of uncharacterised function, DUF393 [Candidatus Ornithobacterium hominis]|uniref:Protein of uncharacterized function, DUF393 n=1 Tax=Candidatus Ornithobacterium hominis TaxID=2497989 RepID=A0A383TW70_9FLAO|nr:DCC1-like thiol-disulfide oxidoreductase family protein [Candidatus Ornithobacterium hominis]MCT7904815.1 DUF393 domain-containing protein [Candidatus Ornithobacterium hominis]SZD71587.1 Protein of uncharacterised function, DUF393 [Candidatus Ornithobacterium hominis]SZD72198.1 Protein of uncharacterised function, DUF393 [Candidatus Ornithobacterium hominis]